MRDGLVLQREAARAGEAVGGDVEDAHCLRLVEPDGALRLRLEDGSLRTISAGDVFFGKPA